ncbi:hypothetical protein C8C99_0492 [Acidovorax sp. 107]|uniref:hypothetical protein n=1 Tax=Acidovorax sp. 107 TaxID=2135638 RepID=UPI000D34F125|nr:hypothetical protein [Acidovorax sp. 107]PUA95691.1 hypothetical protein C8C99_0492 [Acidovorax sp. 107]
MHIPAFASDRYLRIVRASGWYDLLVTWPFALPWTFAWLYAQLNLLAQTLALPGILHPLDATHMLLANLLGSVVVVWSVARIVAPTVLLGRLDGVARFLFAAWLIYAVAHGANAIVLGFAAFELVFGVLQWWRVVGTGAALCPPGPARINARARAAA